MLLFACSLVRCVCDFVLSFAPGFDHTQTSTVTGAAVTQIDIREQIAKCVLIAFFPFEVQGRAKLFSLLASVTRVPFVPEQARGHTNTLCP